MERNSKISTPLLYGFALSTIGGPLAFIALYLIGAFWPALNSLGLVAIVGVLLFFFPILIWYNYSRKIASSGGLYEFVRQSAGERIASIQGWTWVLSYMLYLPYTVTYILFFILPSIASVPQSYLYALEIILPLILSFMMLLSRKVGLSFLFLAAISQIAVALVFLLFAFTGNGISFATLQPNSNPLQLLQGSFGISLLFICASLLLFLGGEARAAKKQMGKVLLVSFSAVALLVILAAILFSPGISSNVSNYILPGFVLAQNYSGIGFATLVGIFVLVSLAGLIIAEFFALSRLLHAMLRIDTRKSIYWISALFILLDVVSLLNPQKFYDYLIVPSLIALYISQLIPVLTYPLFLKKFFRRVTALDAAVTTIAAVLIIYGLVTATFSAT